MASSNTSTEQIGCYCSSCDLHLYTCANAWAQISHTSYTCERPETLVLVGLVAAGQSRAGNTASELEGCVVQPLRCEKCGTGLGLKCIETPIAKAGYKDRYFLKLPKIIIRSSATGQKVEPYMERSLATHAGAKTAKNPFSTSLTTNRPSASTVTGSASGSDAPPFGALEVQQQKMDIDRLMAKFEGFQKDMDMMKTVVEEIKKATQKSSRQSNSHAFTEELELLTENVSQVGRKASEIDTLKLELGMMKRRIKRLEEADAGTQSTHTVTGLTPSSAAAPRTGRKSGPLARRTKNPDNSLLGQVLPPESLKLFKGATDGRLSYDINAGQQLIRDSAKLSPALSGEEPVRKYRPHPDSQDLLHHSKNTQSQVQDAAGLPRKAPPPSRFATIEDPHENHTAQIENLGPGQTQDGSYQPSQDINMDMDDSIDMTQITDSAIGSCTEPPGRPGEIRRSTMTKLPLPSLPLSSNLPSTSPSSDADTDTDPMDEESFRPFATTAPDHQDPDAPSTTINHPPTNPSRLASPSDNDFIPRPEPTTHPRARARKSEPGKIRPATPDWAKPDVDSPDDRSAYPAYAHKARGSARGRKVVRRGVSGGERAPKRMKGGADDGEEEWGDGRVRDSEGFLLLSNGKRDGRSARGRRSAGGGKGGASASASARGGNGHERLMRQIFPGRG